MYSYSESVDLLQPRPRLLSSHITKVSVSCDSLDRARFWYHLPSILQSVETIPAAHCRAHLIGCETQHSAIRWMGRMDKREGVGNEEEQDSIESVRVIQAADFRREGRDHG